MKNLLNSHLQTVILLLVCESCEAEKKHGGRTKPPVDRPQPEIEQKNWFLFQKMVCPIWPERALLGIPAKPVVKRNK